MTAAYYGIILSGHFNAHIFTTLPLGRGRVSCQSMGHKGVVATSQNCIFLGFLVKIFDSDDVKRAIGTFLVSMERGDSYLFSRTKIIRIRGFTAKI